MRHVPTQKTRSTGPHRSQETTRGSAARPGRIKRFLKPRRLEDLGESIAELLNDEDGEEPGPSIEKTVTPSSAPDPRLEKVAGQIHESSLGCLRVVKAAVDFGRAAGRALAEAQNLMAEAEFDRWVQGSLAISPSEAHAMLRFSRRPEIHGADVSPAKAMTLKTALGLFGLLRSSPA